MRARCSDFCRFAWQFDKLLGLPDIAYFRDDYTSTLCRLGEVRVPAPIVGMPMTYSVGGRQYIVVGVSGGNYTGEYIAFRLPASELPKGNTAAGQ